MATDFPHAALDPELAVLHEFPPLDLTDPEAQRALMLEAAAEQPPVDFGAIEVTQRTIPGFDGAPDVPVRILAAPGTDRGRPGVLDIHGGGLVIGQPEMDDLANVAIATGLGGVVVSVDYRLAPEHPYPAANDDAFAALTWFVANAETLGVDPGRIALLGDSGGGHMAASTALRARDRGGPSFAMLAMLEPMLDDRCDSGSMRSLGDDALIWTRTLAVQAWAHYLGGRPADGYAAPARMEDVSRLPPTYITVNELDPLRDEGLDFARRLLGAGVSTELHLWPGACHGFQLAPDAAVSRRALEALVAALGRGLAKG